MDKRELERLQRDALADSFKDKDLSALDKPLPKNPEFERRINLCPFCGDDIAMFASENNLLMNGTWHIDCARCDLKMREDFVLGKEKRRAKMIILDRWNSRKI